MIVPFENDYYVNNNSFELCGDQFVYLLSAAAAAEFG